jgi:hypothetical protein
MADLAYVAGDLGAALEVMPPITAGYMGELMLQRSIVVEDPAQTAGLEFTDGNTRLVVLVSRAKTGRPPCYYLAASLGKAVTDHYADGSYDSLEDLAAAVESTVAQACALLFSSR